MLSTFFSFVCLLFQQFMRLFTFKYLNDWLACCSRIWTHMRVRCKATISLFDNSAHKCFELSLILQVVYEHANDRGRRMIVCSSPENVALNFDLLPHFVFISSYCFQGVRKTIMSQPKWIEVQDMISSKKWKIKENV